ncbi:SusC/RagA family TonB-linked outer membrane protein [Parapedobacter composti]|nr:TonB-dependent receptor [Parapedobacter composti]
MAFCQEPPVIKGNVVDVVGDGIQGVSVQVKGTSKGTVSDNNGAFSISLTGQEPDGLTLRFSSVGYITRELLIGKEREIRVVLEADDSSLDEVVVVGYGQQRKVTLTGSVSSVSGTELVKQLSPDFAGSLKGRLPGLTVVQSTGMPGADDAALYLRGVATTNGVSPLLLIDGVVSEMSELRHLDPFSVANVSVLKDASATAVFGVRGANGVIIITTKRGELGKVNVSVSSDQSLQEMAYLPDRLDSYDYVHLRNEALANEGMPLEYSDESIEKFESWRTGNPVDPYWHPNNNWVDILFKRFAPMSRSNINLSGGTERLKYFVSTGYLTQGGLFNVEPKEQLKYDAQTKVNRYNFRANVDFTISKAITAYANLSAHIERVNNSNLINGQFGFATLFVDALTSRPTNVGPLSQEGVPLYINGELQPLEPGRIVSDRYGTGSSYGDLNRQGYSLGTRSGFNGNFGMNFDLGTITEGLDFRASVALTTTGVTTMNGTKNYVVFNYQDLIQDGEQQRVYVINRGNEVEDNPLSLSKSARSSIRANFQGQLNYNRSFGKHNLGGLVLVQRDYWEVAEGSGYQAPYLPFNVLGLSARTTYGYDNRYLFEFNAGYNGSEQFSPKKRFGFFPAFSAGWVVSNEPFFARVNGVSELKIRYSFGYVGNDRFGSSRFLYLDNLAVGSSGLYGKDIPSLGGSGNKINETMIGNPNITWELAQKQNLGLDISARNGLSFTGDFYVENRSNILLTRQSVPAFQGLPLGAMPALNIGEIRNTGFELLLKYDKSFNPDFSLNSSVNIGYNKNRVESFDEPLRTEDYVYRRRIEGFSLGQQWGYKIDYSTDPERGRDGSGFFNSYEDIANSGLNYQIGTPRPGDFIYVDQNGDGLINDADMVPIGASNLPNTTYGIQLDFRYKNFDVSFLGQGVASASKYYEGPGIFEEMGSASFYPWQLNRWSEERYQRRLHGEDIAITHPRLATTTSSSHIANDYYIMSIAYFRLRNVLVGYTLPERWTNRFARTVRIYANATNLFTFHGLRMNSFDPEQANGFVYPLMKNYTLGVNVNF